MDRLQAAEARGDLCLDRGRESRRQGSGFARPLVTRNEVPGIVFERLAAIEQAKEKRAHICASTNVRLHLKPESQRVD